MTDSHHIKKLMSGIPPGRRLTVTSACQTWLGASSAPANESRLWCDPSAQ